MQTSGAEGPLTHSLSSAHTPNANKQLLISGTRSQGPMGKGLIGQLSWGLGGSSSRSLRRAPHPPPHPPTHRYTPGQKSASEVQAGF